MDGVQVRTRSRGKHLSRRAGCVAARREYGGREVTRPQEYEVIEVPFQVEGKRMCWWKATVLEVEWKGEEWDAEIEFHGKGVYSSEKWEVRFLEDQCFVRIGHGVGGERHVWRNEGDRAIRLPDTAYAEPCRAQRREGGGEAAVEGGTRSIGGSEESGDCSDVHNKREISDFQCVCKKDMCKEGAVCDKCHKHFPCCSGVGIEELKSQMNNVWEELSVMRREVTSCKLERDMERTKKNCSYLVANLRSRMLKKFQEPVTMYTAICNNEFSRIVCRDFMTLESDCSMEMFRDMCKVIYDLMESGGDRQHEVLYFPSYMSVRSECTTIDRKCILFYDIQGLFELLGIGEEDDKRNIMVRIQQKNGSGLCRVVGGGQWDEGDPISGMNVHIGRSSFRTVKGTEACYNDTGAIVLHRKTCAWDRDLNYFREGLEKKMGFASNTTFSNVDFKKDGNLSEVHGIVMEWLPMEQPSSRKWRSASHQPGGHVLGKCVLKIPIVQFYGNRICEEVVPKLTEM